MNDFVSVYQGCDGSKSSGKEPNATKHLSWVICSTRLVVSISNFLQMYIFLCKGFCKFTVIWSKSKQLRIFFLLLLHTSQMTGRMPPSLLPFFPPSASSRRAWSWTPGRTKQADEHQPDTPLLSGFRVSRAHPDKEKSVVLDVLFSVGLWLQITECWTLQSFY